MHSQGCATISLSNPATPSPQTPPLQKQRPTPPSQLLVAPSLLSLPALGPLHWPLSLLVNTSLRPRLKCQLPREVVPDTLSRTAPTLLPLRPIPLPGALGFRAFPTTYKSVIHAFLSLSTLSLASSNATSSQSLCLPASSPSDQHEGPLIKY